MSPNWLMSLTKLKTVSIRGASKLMSLPPLGKFPFLESLTIWNVCSLKKVCVEFLGIESENKNEDIIVFPNLKYLTFGWLEEWEEWIGIGGKEDEDCITIMPLSSRVDNSRLRKVKVDARLPAYNSIEGIGDHCISNYQGTLPKRDRRGLANNLD